MPSKKLSLHTKNFAQTIIFNSKFGQNSSLLGIELVFFRSNGTNFFSPTFFYAISGGGRKIMSAKIWGANFAHNSFYSIMNPISKKHYIRL